MSEAGARERRDRLVLENRGLAGAIAKRYEDRGLDYGDLVAAGYLGLIEAAGRYDEARSRFANYAGHWIRLRIREALAENALTILPRHAYLLVGRYIRAARELRGRLGRDPDRSETIATLNLSAARRAILEAALATLGREPLNADYDAPVAGPGPDEIAESRDDARALLDRVADLDPLSRSVLTRRFGLHGHPEQTLVAVAADLGLTRDRVVDVQRRAIRRLRDRLAAADREG